MKHLILASLTTAILLIPSDFFAADEAGLTADPFPQEREGQYIYYHDRRKGVYGSNETSDLMIGLMKADNRRYIIRTLNLKNGDSNLFLGRYILKNGVFEYIPESVQGDRKKGVKVLADIVNLMRYLNAETVKNKNRIISEGEFSDRSAWGDYRRELVNRYKWWIPFYKLDSSINFRSDAFGDEGYINLKVICFGMAEADDPDMFTRFKKLPVYHSERISGTKFSLPDSSPVNFKLDNIRMKLDNNWIFEKGDRYQGQADTYVLKKFTGRDAQIGVETVSLENIRSKGDETFTFLTSLQFQSSVIADTVSVNKKRKILSLTIWDPDSETATVVKYAAAGSKGGVLTMLNLSVLDFIYFSNLDYFENILKSIGK